MRKVRIYTIGKTKLIAELNVKNTYESSFYFSPMPTISGRRCTKILNELYPHYKADDVQLVFEWVDSGFTWVQGLYRDGTILVG